MMQRPDTMILLFLGIGVVCGQAAGLPGLLVAWVSLTAAVAVATRG